MGALGSADVIHTLPSDVGRSTSAAHETPPWESIWPRSPPLTSATDINRARNWPSTRSRSGRVLKIAITSPVGVASGPLRVAANFSAARALPTVVRSCLL